MKVVKLKGLQKKVYSVIGKYAMNADVIKSLGNPITTNFNCTWYLLYDNTILVAFLCVELKGKVSVIRNMVAISESKKVTMTHILPIVLADFKDVVTEIKAYCKNNELDVFYGFGFELSSSKKTWSYVTKKI